MTLLGHERQLILYATPTGELSTAVEDYFRRVVVDLEPTEAQRFPPHVSLTGFFWRNAQRAEEIDAAVAGLVRAIEPAPPAAVEVTGLVTEPEWIGLTIDSAWLVDLTRRFVDGQRVLGGEDSLRPKGWLHLSLAYGLDDGPLDRHAGLAREVIDPNLDAGWEVALWERTTGSSSPRWIRRT